MKEHFLSTSFIGKVSHRFPQIVSTNNFAKELISKGEPEHGTVILADFQSIGRGQTGNYWHSSPGKNLLNSIILQPKSSLQSIHFYYNKVIALSVAQLVEQKIGRSVDIKWPNDILVDNHKIAGILIENIFSGSQLHYCVIGIGLNVNQQIFPIEIDKPTSISLETGTFYEVIDIAEELYKQIESNLLLVSEQKTKEIDLLYHEKLFRWKEPNLYEANGKKFIGKIIEVDEQGCLLVEINQQILRFRNQEIKFII